jgi:aminoglycoside phosphotransferase (APT) family kinase protein
MVNIDIDINMLAARMTAIQASGLRPLPGGASSLSYAATATVDGVARGVVVKVAPPGLPPVRNRDVLRQARLLRALAPTAVPVPEVLWEDPGDPPEIPPVFVMAFVEGTSLEPLFDLDGDEDPGVVGNRLLNAARVLAVLHRLDPAGIGLSGEPLVGPAAEVERWVRALGTVDPALVPGWEAVGEALLATVPSALGRAVVHGDYRLGNLLASGAEVSAVIDWEIWSVGDPRVDVGWFLANADPATYRRATRYARTLPGPAEVAAAYAEALGRDLPEVEWFQALACFKSAATWSLIVKHARRRSTPDPLATEMAGRLPALLARAREFLG